MIRFKTFTDSNDQEIENWLNSINVVKVLSYDKRWLQDTYDTGEICNRYMETCIICVCGGVQ